MVWKDWSRSDKFALIAIVATVLGVLASGVVVPEIRKLFGLDKTKETFIRGQWNEKEARQAVIDLMKRNPQKIDYKRYKDDDIVVNFYNVAYIKKASMVVIAHPSEGSPCHSCGVEFSIFEFEKKDENWVLEGFHIDAFEAGYGGSPPNSIKILPIGFDKFGVVTENNNAMYQGVRMTSTTIYSIVNEKFREVFSEVTSSDNSDNILIGLNQTKDVWKSEIKFNQQGTSFYDLVIHKKGVENGKNLNTTIVFKFDGQEYSTSNFYK